jgi:hypothetical protein
MRGKAWNSNARRIGLLPLVVFLIGTACNAPAATQDCYGYSVPDSLYTIDSVRVSGELKSRLDTVSGAKLLDLSFGFLLFKEDSIPDSCHDVFCSGYDTLAGHFYKIWNKTLFTDYEIFSSPDTLHRVTPEQVGAGGDYNHLFASKPTILAFSKECYIRGVGSSYASASALIQKRIRSPKAAGSQFDALGRNPESRHTPPNPLPTPTFTPR